ncbi:hypothetical protein [Ktedonobacter sp. SOSP1-52]|uniref:hypothetical protein n=1 Tax=Ktedonobacter sp. SOSP1-52 TaxID=2778366 RepID=UPI0035B17C64
MLKLAVVERRLYINLRALLQAAEQWVTFYNQRRSHQCLEYCSPDQFAQGTGLPIVPFHPCSNV